MAYNFVRSLREKEHPLTVVLHFQLAGAVAGVVSLFFAWKTPTGWDWLMLFLVGVFAQLGQISDTRFAKRAGRGCRDRELYGIDIRFAHRVVRFR